MGCERDGSSQIKKARRSVRRIYFSLHARKKLLARSTLWTEDVLRMLKYGQCVLFGSDEKAKHFLLYSVQDEDCLVVIQDSSSGQIITIRRAYERLRIVPTDDAWRKAKQLVLGEVARGAGDDESCKKDSAQLLSRVSTPQVFWVVARMRDVEGKEIFRHVKGFLVQIPRGADLENGLRKALRGHQVLRQTRAWCKKARAMGFEILEVRVRQEENFKVPSFSIALNTQGVMAA